MAALKEDRLAIDVIYRGWEEISLMDRVDEEAVLVGVCGCVHVLKVTWMAWC